MLDYITQSLLRDIKLQNEKQNITHKLRIHSNDLTDGNF